MVSASSVSAHRRTACRSQPRRSRQAGLAATRQGWPSDPRMRALCVGPSLIVRACASPYMVGVEEDQADQPRLAESPSLEMRWGVRVPRRVLKSVMGVV